MKTDSLDFTPLTPANILSWTHFGDLHLTTEDAQNYQDFVAVIANANIHLAGPRRRELRAAAGRLEPCGDNSTWSLLCNPGELADGEHPLTVWAVNQKGEASKDTINLLIDRAGSYQQPQPKPIDMGNRIGAYLEKGIPGTLLGPNLLGHPW